MRIETKRLMLRPLSLQDLHTTHRYSSDPENAPMMVYLPYANLEETIEFLMDIEAEWKKEIPDFYEFAVDLDGQHIGSVNLYVDAERTEAELAWIIHKDHWGQGYGTEAAQALVEFAVKDLGIRHFIAHCDSENVGSARIMEKLGMTLVHTEWGRKNRASDQIRQERMYEMRIR